ncbi:S9 family peptidase [Agromyces sp. Leaf222]|uniref:alpha/beta hydrolase family protein n=1 Tax=Agromyces sp. Leaf222 TaxID=1735688 RepID=UPI001F3B8974|nr:alpha/beta fold hydrolase [Agromyces sp. Leaf222]
MLGALAAVSLAFVGLGYVIARRVTAPAGPRMFDLVVRGLDESGETPMVILARTPKTEVVGQFNLILESGDWVRLGPRVIDLGAGLVGRDVEQPDVPPSLVPGARASWSGIYFRTPADAGLHARDVEIRTPVGPAPAWVIVPQQQASGDWAIHIHGLGSPRAGTLRGVQVATDVGLTSLVVSFRNDGEGPQVGSGRSTLGALETDDVESAVQYALDQGARRIILFGWSMGGAIALQLASRSGVRKHLAGIVLESPVLDWIETIKANCVHTGMPGWVGVLAVPWLDLPALSRFAGLAAPVVTGAFNQIAGPAYVALPILLLHGTADTSAPVDAAHEFARLNPAVEVSLFGADHTFTWNVDPNAWRACVSAWLGVWVSPKHN